MTPLEHNCIWFYVLFLFFAVHSYGANTFPVASEQKDRTMSGACSLVRLCLVLLCLGRASLVQVSLTNEQTHFGKFENFPCVLACCELA